MLQAKHYKDSIHGIVPSDDPTPPYASASSNQTAFLGENDSRPSTSSSSSSSSSSILSAHADRYTTPNPNTTADGGKPHAASHNPFKKFSHQWSKIKEIAQYLWLFSSVSINPYTCRENNLCCFSPTPLKKCLAFKKEHSQAHLPEGVNEGGVDVGRQPRMQAPCIRGDRRGGLGPGCTILCMEADCEHKTIG